MSLTAFRAICPTHPACVASRLPTGIWNRNCSIKGMCLAVPGKILEAEECDGSRIARVRFGGVTREAYLNFVPEAEVGDYVMVHAGFAISVVDEQEAVRTFELLESAGLLAGDLGPEAP